MKTACHRKVQNRCIVMWKCVTGHLLNGAVLEGPPAGWPLQGRRPGLQRPAGVRICAAYQRQRVLHIGCTAPSPRLI